jgi:peptidoglycan/xylan/chitin deacetylase (PgdA/CDA1 family)
MTVWLICDVDTEFDSLRDNLKTSSNSNPGLTIGVQKLLEFFDDYNLNATFHIQEQSDPDTSIINRYPNIVEEIKGYGHEISLHTHIKEEDYDNRKKEIVAGYDRLSKAGFKINTFRAGWYFSNENTIRILEELGIKYDCSPYKNLTVGSKSWVGIPDSPYHPDYDDVTKLGVAKILMIPINDIRLGIGIHKEDEWESELMKRGIRNLISKADEIKEPLIIYFTTHSWKPVDEKGNLRNWEKKRREEFIETLGQRKFKSLTVQEAGSRWGENKYRPYFLDLPDLIGSSYRFYDPRRNSWSNKNLISKAHILRYKLLGKL